MAADSAIGRRQALGSAAGINAVQRTSAIIWSHGYRLWTEYALFSSQSGFHAHLALDNS